MNNFEKAVGFIEKSNQTLREEFQKYVPKRLWEHTHIKHQIDNRAKGYSFSLSEHIRAMVYAMISSGIAWERIEPGICIATGRILPLDNLFHQYDADYLLKCNPDDLAEGIQELGYASRYTQAQMKALLETNIGKLQRWEKGCGSIDDYYRQFTEKDPSFKTVLHRLADSGSRDKLSQLGVALASEYLRNVGYDLAKPDRHLKRILGSRGLGCSEREEATDNEVFDIVRELAAGMEKQKAEVDYILWSACAKGYGGLYATKGQSACDECSDNRTCCYRMEGKA